MKKKKEEKPKKQTTVVSNDEFRFHDNELCDLDPRTLKWKRGVKKGAHLYMCMSCVQRVKAGEK